MENARNARQRASLKSFPGLPAGKSSGATSATTSLAWTSSSLKTRLYMICKTSLVGAVVAQPGRALDLFKRGEAEDRAVVSSNLTDGTLNYFLTSFATLSIILPDAARWFLASNIAASSFFVRCFEMLASFTAASKKCSPLSSAENATRCMSR